MPRTATRRVSRRARVHTHADTRHDEAAHPSPVARKATAEDAVVARIAQVQALQRKVGNKVARSVLTRDLDRTLAQRRLTANGVEVDDDVVEEAEASNNQNQNQQNQQQQQQGQQAQQQQQQQATEEESAATPAATAIEATTEAATEATAPAIDREALFAELVAARSKLFDLMKIERQVDALEWMRSSLEGFRESVAEWRERADSPLAYRSYEFREWRRAKCASDFNIAAKIDGAIGILSASRSASAPGMSGVTAAPDTAAVAKLEALRGRVEAFREGNLIGTRGGGSYTQDQEWERWARNWHVEMMFSGRMDAAISAAFGIAGPYRWPEEVAADIKTPLERVMVLQETLYPTVAST